MKGGSGGPIILAASAVVSRLRVLNLGLMDLDTAAVRALADSPFLSSQLDLGLHTGSVGDEGMALLAEASHLTALRELDLSSATARGANRPDCSGACATFSTVR